jgi:site-specific DNA-methyltransferase (adenine-specific)
MMRNFERTLTAEDFMALTLDVWQIPPESARRVGHPAPFPVELPEQLIRLYTFVNDLVLDPFMGSGSALVAAARLGRRYVGYDLDPGYVELARRRVAGTSSEVTAQPAPEFGGLTATKLAARRLVEAGFAIEAADHRIRGTGVSVSFVAHGSGGATWYFDVAGSSTSQRPGLLRTDAVWRALGRAAAVRHARGDVPLVLLTPSLPSKPSEAEAALRAAGADTISDVVDLLDDGNLERLARYGRGEAAPLPGFWTVPDLTRTASERPAAAPPRP